MAYRLLVDLEVFTALDALPRKTRTRLLDHFRQLRAAPDQHSDYHEQDRVGRRVEINVIAGYAIHFRIDFADRHIKILTLKPADA